MSGTGLTSWTKILNRMFDPYTHFFVEKGSSKVRVGQILQGVVRSVDRARKVVHMDFDPDVVSNCATKELTGVSLDLLVPGMLVNASVLSTLENGVMLSFLTYFTGTVDVFNLDKMFPSSKWKDDYSKNMRIAARILFIDPSTRAVGLTLNPYLVGNKAPPSLVKIGDIFGQSKVIRVDKGSGLLLETPTLPVPTPVYVNVTDVADKEVQKLENKFKEGSLVRVRVLGFRRLEGLATGILKTSAFEGSVFTHSDVKPGMVVKAKVITVDSFGAIVQFSSGVKALCPRRHMSELEILKPRKKFQVGVELVFRVLGCKSKRITVTHKKTLVKSRLEILSSYADATNGLITHGWITKIENHGCFVRFYNGVQGFAPRYELCLDPGSDIGSVYHVEQVIKCRVVKCIRASRRIHLSFNTSLTRAVGVESVKPGSLVAGVVKQVSAHEIAVDINASTHMKGTISLEHLADHHGLASLMVSTLKPGYQFDQLLVLDIERDSLVLTAKYSLINSAQELPVDVTQICRHSTVPVDEERNRVSLGMKKSYFKDEETLEMISRQSPDDDVEKNSSIVAAETMLQRTSASIENSNLEVESGYHSMLADFENRALVPPLEVPLDDIEIPDNEVDVDHVPNAADAEIIEEKNKRARKKAREESEEYELLEKVQSKLAIHPLIAPILGNDHNKYRRRENLVSL